MVIRWGTSENDRRARYYTLSAAGRRQLAAERAEFERMVGAIQRVLASRMASMSEIVVGSSDVDTVRLEWQRLLDPARPTRAGAWQVGTGPAIRVVPARGNRVEELVVRVRSLAARKRSVTPRVSSRVSRRRR